MKSRYLGVDPGGKRIGLAISDPDSGVVSPLRILRAGPTLVDDAAGIIKVAEEFAAEAIVIGLALNMDYGVGPQAALAQKLAEAIQRQTPLPVHLHDERLTSHAADGLLIDRQLTRKQRKARHDGLAAAVMLESFLQCQKEADNP